MRLLDRYIARQVFVSAMFAVAIIIIILVLGNVFKEILRELAKRPDLDLIFVLKFIALVIPISLSLAIPFSFLTAILLTFGRLSADSEFISMRMAGLNMWRICLPVGVLAIFFTSICAIVNLSVTPWAKTEMEGMKASLINLIKREPMLLFPDGQVMADLPGHLVYAKKENGILKEFQMIKMEGDLPHILAIAEQAEVAVDMEREDPEMALTMKNVNLVTRGGDGDFLSSSHPFFMEEATAGVPLSQFSLAGNDVRDQPENISLGRLIQKTRDPELEPAMQATYRTELSMRMAFSLSCITFGLIGVPLGVTAQRRESTAGFVFSMIIAVSYYVMLTLAALQRTNEAAYPHLLVWIPNILFISLGIFLFWRLSRR
ncbi:MAG: LptF/LptG family permease [Verrucomicrobiales bacterium]|nr:LptF/LptG family permease [Verrucomicrobiales bacterium]